MKWKNIRGGFVRYLKALNTTGSGAKKPYYLWEVLQFLIPYTKSRTQSGNLQENQTPTDQYQEPEGNDGDDIESEDHAVEENFPAVNIDRPTDINVPAAAPPSPVVTPSSSLSAWRSNKAKNKKCDPLEKAVTHYFTKKASEDKISENNPDLDFFKSILPDIAHFTPATKRQFKRKIMDLIDELSEDSTPSSRSRCSSATPHTLTDYSTPEAPSEFAYTSGPSRRPYEAVPISRNFNVLSEVLNIEGEEAQHGDNVLIMYNSNGQSFSK